MITQSRLKELLHYEPDTGVFVWKVGRQGTEGIGSVAGWVSNFGYVRISVDRKSYLAHRLAWLYVKGAFPEHDIDHVNHYRTDNRIENLRATTRGENLRNASISKRNKSGFTGVGWCKQKNKWRAYIMVNGKHKNLGCFTDKQDAISVRKEANIKYGYHKNHGGENV